MSKDPWTMSPEEADRLGWGWMDEGWPKLEMAPTFPADVSDEMAARLDAAGDLSEGEFAALVDSLGVRPPDDRPGWTLVMVPDLAREDEGHHVWRWTRSEDDILIYEDGSRRRRGDVESA